jgi:serine/threonine-protein kinase ULK/ATG1
MESHEFQNFCGTPLNMAPEVLFEEPYDLRADVWSIGVVIFELISGQKPFNAISSSELKLNLNNGVYKLPKNT